MNYLFPFPALHVYLKHWAAVRMASEHHVVAHAEQHGAAEQEGSVVHAGRRDLGCAGPKAEEEHDQQVPHREDIVDNTKYAAQPPWAPHQRDTAGLGVLRAVGVGNGATEAVPQEQGGHNDVGGEETGNGQRDDGVEGSGGADDDQAESARD